LADAASSSAWTSLRFQNRYIVIRLCQLETGGKSGKPSTNDDNLLDRPRSSVAAGIPEFLAAEKPWLPRCWRRRQ